MQSTAARLSIRGEIRRKADAAFVLRELGLEDARTAELKRGVRFQLVADGVEEALGDRAGTIVDLILDVPVLEEKVKSFQAAIFVDGKVARFYQVSP